MNNSTCSYLPTTLVPARCNGAPDSVATYLKCLVSRSLNGFGLADNISKRNRAMQQVAELRALPSSLQHDIGMTQGQRLAAELASVLYER